jgi:hypothetical protein
VNELCPISESSDVNSKAINSTELNPSIDDEYHADPLKTSWKNKIREKRNG